MASVSVLKKKCRQYSIEYLAYGFIESPMDNKIPLCLICNKTLCNDSMRPSKLKIHLETNHKDKKDKPVNYFQNLYDNYKKRSTIKHMFAQRTSNISRGLIASYEISNLIAKNGKPHNIGEKLILPAVSVVISSMTNQNSNEIISNIPLSNNTVSRRIDEMAHDVEEQLIKELRVREFSFQIDESTLINNEAILLTYVRFIRDDQLVEEMLFARKLITDTTGKSIFEVVQKYFNDNSIPLKNIIACATDGAASMTGRYKGFLAYLKNHVPALFSIHCVIHRQHLVAKDLGGRLHEALSAVIKAVNYIKSNASQNRLFSQLCKDNDEEYERLVLHTAVRWLSKGNCLRRFVVLWDSLKEFFEESAIGENILAAKTDIFYLSDIFDKFNMLNKKLQGKNSNLISSRDLIRAFLSKLELFRSNLLRREFFHFASLATISNDVQSEDLQVYTYHLKKLDEEMKRRFHDLLELEIPEWVVSPFESNIETVAIELQEQLIDLQSDSTLQLRYKRNPSSFWISAEIKDKFFNLWKKAIFFYISFPSSYLVESGFSRLNYLLSKTRNRLNIEDRGDLRLVLTNFKPSIEKLASVHQPQGSH